MIQKRERCRVGASLLDRDSNEAYGEALIDAWGRTLGPRWRRFSDLRQPFQNHLVWLVADLNQTFAEPSDLYTFLEVPDAGVGSRSAR